MDTYLVNVRWGGLYIPYQPLLKKTGEGRVLNSGKVQTV